MKFGQIEMLNLLWAVVLFGIFLGWGFQHRKKILERFVQSQLISQIAPSLDLKKEMLKPVLLIVVVILSVLALARPQWGFEWQKINRQGLDIMIVVDTSKSMLTQDIRPSRLERTKLAIKDLIKKMQGDRIGLMAFAGTAFMTCPLTSDYGGFSLALEDLGIDTIPQGGSNLENAIKEAVKGFDQTPNQFKTIVLLTDGESLEGDINEGIKAAKEKGIKIFCVGVGTKEGELIRISNAEGKNEFLKDSGGNFVKSRLNENVLKQIAKETGGTYARLSGGEFGLDAIFETQLAGMERREIENKMEKKYYERFQFPLAFAFVLLIVENLLSQRKTA